MKYTKKRKEKKRRKARNCIMDIMKYKRQIVARYHKYLVRSRTELHFHLPALCIFFGRPSSEFISSELRLEWHIRGVTNSNLASCSSLS
ncbi:hypothetical protein X777_14846 [Ooceraea biroi]|uniref:Uncharacterized protein n=1 Tax=Ooceraea biroi TaxID=2015173 RepID=A0A026WRN2_OOCBI|nr:hypothetical protein X777_14846 [Ooceraea biroi]